MQQTLKFEIQWPLDQEVFLLFYTADTYVHLTIGKSNSFDNDEKQMSRDMWFPTMWQFDKYRLRRACAASL